MTAESGGRAAVVWWLCILGSCVGMVMVVFQMSLNGTTDAGSATSVQQDNSNNNNNNNDHRHHYPRAKSSRILRSAESMAIVTADNTSVSVVSTTSPLILPLTVIWLMETVAPIVEKYTMKHLTEGEVDVLDVWQDSLTAEHRSDGGRNYTIMAADGIRRDGMKVVLAGSYALVVYHHELQQVYGQTCDTCGRFVLQLRKDQVQHHPVVEVRLVAHEACRADGCSRSKVATSYPMTLLTFKAVDADAKQRYKTVNQTAIENRDYLYLHAYYIIPPAVARVATKEYTLQIRMTFTNYHSNNIANTEPAKEGIIPHVQGWWVYTVTRTAAVAYTTTATTANTNIDMPGNIAGQWRMQSRLMSIITMEAGNLRKLPAAMYVSDAFSKGTKVLSLSTADIEYDFFDRRLLSNTCIKETILAEGPFCQLGDSHGRFLHNSIHRFIEDGYAAWLDSKQSIDPLLVRKSFDTVIDQWSHFIPIKKINDKSKDYAKSSLLYNIETDPRLKTCRKAVVNSGLWNLGWPAKAEGPMATNHHSVVMSHAIDILQSQVITINSTSKPQQRSSSDLFLISTEPCFGSEGKYEWRNHGSGRSYSRSECALAAHKNISCIDTYRLVEPVMDLTLDGCHYNFPLNIPFVISVLSTMYPQCVSYK
jgi:hypothetical protein